MKRMSLKVKLLFINLALAFTMGLIGWIFVRHFYTVVEAQSLKTYESYAVSLSDSIAAQFYERYGDVQAFALNKAIVSANNKDEVVENLNQYSALYGIYDLILVVGIDGHLIGVNNKSPDGKAINVEALYKKSYSDEEWFKKVLKGELTEDKSKDFTGTYVQDFQVDPLVSEIYKEPRFGNSFNAAVHDASGKIIAVVSNRAGGRWIEASVKDTYLKLVTQGLQNSEITMLNKDGFIIVDYDPSLRNGNKEIFHDFENVILKLNLREKNQAGALILKDGKTASAYTEHARKKIVQAMGVSPVSGYKFIDSIGWGVMVRTPKKELLAESEKVMSVFYTFMAFILALSVVISIWFSGRLAKLLKILADQLQNNSVKLNEMADKFATSSLQLSESTVGQASALQETVTSIDEVSAMVSKNAENAEHSNKYSSQSSEAVKSGQGTVAKMISSIGDISQSNNDIMVQIEESHRDLASIVTLINDIAVKTKVINDIVFQTKLLSFNASVEAARAGEHGKGFAVVAEEVGNLASMSGHAAQEITEMLDGSIKKVEGIVSHTKSSVNALIEKGKVKVDEGTVTAKQCGKVFEEITHNVANVSRMIDEIALASKEQSQGVQQITVAMNKLDQITQENSIQAKESSVSAQQLRGQADELEKSVGELILMVEGQRKYESQSLEQDSKLKASN